MDQNLCKKEFPVTPFLGILSYLAQDFILALVWLAGAILARATRQQHPKVSRFTLIALAIFFVETLVSAFANLYLPLMLGDRGWTISQLQIWISLQNGLFSLIRAAAWCFILAAIFGKRD